MRSAMGFDEAARTWAAGKIGVKPEDVARVVIRGEEGYSYSSWTYEPATFAVWAVLADRSHREIFDLTDRPEWDFLDLFKEILEASA